MLFYTIPRVIIKKTNPIYFSLFSWSRERWSSLGTREQHIVSKIQHTVIHCLHFTKSATKFNRCYLLFIRSQNFCLIPLVGDIQVPMHNLLTPLLYANLQKYNSKTQTINSSVDPQCTAWLKRSHEHSSQKFSFTVLKHHGAFHMKSTFNKDFTLAKARQLKIIWTQEYIHW